MKPFEIHPARSVTEAVQLLNEYGEQAKLYAGGTELLLVMKAGLLHYEHLIDVKTIPGLNLIEYRADTGCLVVGGGASHRHIEQAPLVHEHLPLLVELERQIANIRVRNVGTIGGNLCFAEPHSDPATLFFALGALLQLEGVAGKRTLSMDEFFLDAYETAIKEDELLLQIDLPIPSAQTWGGYQRFQVRERPALNIAVLLSLDRAREGVEEVRVAVGGVNPKPYRAVEAESLLGGKGLEESTAQLPQASRLTAAPANPVEDLDGSAPFKRHLIEVLTQRAFLQAKSRIPRAAPSD